MRTGGTRPTGAVVAWARARAGGSRRQHRRPCRSPFLRRGRYGLARPGSTRRVTESGTGAGAPPRGRRGRRRQRPGSAFRCRPLGPQRAPPRLDPPALRPDLPVLVPHRVGRPRAPAREAAARCSSSNHAGAIPSDAPAIMHGIETELGRPVYGMAEYLFRAMPVVGTLWSRGGGVPAHPDNAYRLLHDEQQLALVFPEGSKATGKPFSRALPAPPLRARRLRARSRCAPACR